MPESCRPLRPIFACVSLFVLGLTAAGCTAQGVAMSAATSAAVTASQERGFQGALQDSEIRLHINHLWFQESEELFTSLYLQVQDGRVLVTGKVPDPQSRVTAARLVWQVNGVREVINEIEVTDKSSLTSYARDNWIIAHLKAKLLFDREVSAINYSIESVNQVVYLLGVAQHAEELERVIAHAKEISYVRRVVSHVSLKGGPSRRASAVPSG